MFDIAIIGLGPAGAILAKLLANKFNIIALDKNNQDTVGFAKPCGGLLAPDAQKILSKLNLTLPKNILVDPQIFSVRTIDVKTKLIRHYQRFYLNMDRRRFDGWLRSLIPANVTTFYGAKCVEIKRLFDGFLLKTIKENQEMTVKARYVIGADGANSLVRRTFYPKFKIRKYLAVQQWFKESHATPFYSCVFDSDTTDCYSWGLSKDASFIFGGAFKIKNARKNFENLKKKMVPFGFKLNNPTKTEACLMLRPKGFNNFCHCKNGVFLVGEAAGFISPSSFEGISYALKSAMALWTAFSKDGKKLNTKYKKATRGIRLRLICKNLKSVFIYNPFFRKIIMTSGIKSVQLIQ